jgi:hypothetical protein
MTINVWNFRSFAPLVVDIRSTKSRAETNLRK